MLSYKHFYLIIKNLRLVGTFYFFFGLSLISTFLEILSIGSILPLLSIIIDETIFEKYLEFADLLLYFSPLQLFEHTYSKHLNYIGGLLILILTVFLLRFIFQVFIEWNKAKLIYKLELLLTNKFYKNYMKAPYLFHLERNSSNFHRDIQSDINYFSATASAITGLLVEMLILIGLLLLVLTTQFLSTLSALVILSFFGYIFLKITNKFNVKLGTDVHYSTKERFKYLIEGFSGIKDIIIFDKINLFINFFEKSNAKLIDSKKKHSIVSSLPRLIIEMLLILGFVIVIFTLIFTGVPINQSLPVLGFFAVASFRMMPSVYRILNYIQRVKFTKKPLENLYEQLINLTEKEEKIIIKKEEVNFNNVLKINDLKFSYTGNKTVLEKLNLEIKKGSSIGIFGESGSGKSTLINIITGLLEPQEGKVYSDNKSIFSNINSWRKNIGYVPQTVFLSDDTLKKNIVFGIEDEKINEKKLELCITNAELKKFINNLQNGLDTFVGESGSKISGGQLQRVGIARALYNDPKILIFDESTSSLDVSTEKEIMKNIYKFKENKTLMIISHKLDLLKNCDEVYELKDKKLFKI